MNQVTVSDTPVKLSTREETIIACAVKSFFGASLPFDKVGAINIGSVMVALNAVRENELRMKLFRAFTSTSPKSKKIRLNKDTGKVTINNI